MSRRSSTPSTSRGSRPWTLGGAGADHAGSISTSATEIVKVALARPADRGEPFTLLEPDQAARPPGPVPGRAGHQPQPAVADPPRGGDPLHPPQDLEGIARPRVRDQEEPDPRPVCPPARQVPGCCASTSSARSTSSRGSGHGWHPLERSPARFRATYKRTAGVRQLVAAYDPATGALYGHLPTARPGARSGSSCARCGPASASTWSSSSTTSARTRRPSCRRGSPTTTSSSCSADLLELAQPHRVPVPGAPLVRPQRHRLREPRRAGRRDPRLPALAQPERPTGQGLAPQRRGPPFAPRRCGMRH